MTIKSKLLAIVFTQFALGISIVCLLIQLPIDTAFAAPAPGEAEVKKQLQSANDQIQKNPNSAQAHFALAEILLKTGQNQEAAKEYLRVTELDPNFYLAYHRFGLTNNNANDLNQVITRITKLGEGRPKDFVLHIALSELLEKQGKFYQGARVLVELMYQNAVPNKYASKVNARIHYLLAKAKDSQELSTEFTFSDNNLDTLPPPLPETTLHKDLSTASWNESSLPSVGTPLLP